ncbi:MAG: CIA30 family protein [Candidatus Goldbacteria bacterium]|nr:CIA30 family protein [Candidatus Goldiibacteriota bacterium]
MKKFFLIVLMIITGLIIIFNACNKKTNINLTSADFTPGVSTTNTQVTGGTATFTKTPTPSPSPPPPCSGVLLDDMEDNNNQNNWGGYWYAYDDLNNGGNSYVVPWSESRWNISGLPTPVEKFYMQSPGRTGSGYAARITGYVTTQFQWGFVGMGTTFLDPKKDIDISMCSSVRFWHKGDGKQYKMKIASNHPNFCLKEGDNHYGRPFTTSTNWKLEDIPISSLFQEPYWGTSVNLKDAMSRATDIQFQTIGQPIASIDLWVDEIQFCGCNTAQMFLTPTPAKTPSKIDDMESGDNINDWGGIWYTYDDTLGSGNSYIVPRPAETFVMSSPGIPNTCGTPTNYAARVTGNVITWQVGKTGLGITLLPSKAIFDLSGCTGIKFYYKGDGRDYYIKIVSAHPDFAGSTNYYGTDFPTSGDWQPRDIKMAELYQIGSGPTVDRTAALSMATDIIFEPIGPGSFEFWIDDLVIYDCPSYPTP